MEKCALRFLLRTYLILNPINPLKRIAYTSCWAKVPNVILFHFPRYKHPTDITFSHRKSNSSNDLEACFDTYLKLNFVKLYSEGNSILRISMCCKKKLYSDTMYVQVFSLLSYLQLLEYVHGNLYVFSCYRRKWLFLLRLTKLYTYTSPMSR